MTYLKKGDKASEMRTGDIVGRCPKCGHSLIIRRTKDGRKFIGCANFKKGGCKNSYSLNSFKVYDQDCIDEVNLRTARIECDLEMAEHIRDTNEGLHFKACWICDDIKKSLWR